MALRIVEVGFWTLGRDACDPIDVLFCDPVAERDGDVHEPTSLGERAGALGRVARRGARELAVVPGMDDRQSRSGVGGRAATILRDGVSGPPGSSAGTASCAASDAELIDHCQRSLRTRRAAAIAGHDPSWAQALAARRQPRGSLAAEAPRALRVHRSSCRSPTPDADRRERSPRRVAGAWNGVER